MYDRSRNNAMSPRCFGSDERTSPYSYSGDRFSHLATTEADLDPRVQAARHRERVRAGQRRSIHEKIVRVSNGAAYRIDIRDLSDLEWRQLWYHGFLLRAPECTQDD